MIITIDTEKEPDMYDVIVHGQSAILCLCEFGNYLRLMARGKATVEDIDHIYERFFDTMRDNDLNRDIVGF